MILNTPFVGRTEKKVDDRASGISGNDRDCGIATGYDPGRPASSGLKS